MAGKQKFTRVPKAEELVPKLREAGVGLHVLPTYHCVLDHADNKTGRAWMSINRIAEILGLCRRTVERHLKALAEAGLVLRNHQQRGKRGRFSTRRYVVVAVLFFKRPTVRHQGQTGKRGSIKRRTKPLKTSPYNPPNGAYNWWLGLPRDLEAEAELKRQREEEDKRRIEGYEWFFGK